jgi:hypothetical protein
VASHTLLAEQQISGSGGTSSFVEEDGSGCFIATAAYGSSQQPQVMTLRRFRDRWLNSHPPGRMLVRTYYISSPPLAAWIARHEWARTTVRGMLWPVYLLAGLTLTPQGLSLLGLGGLLLGGQLLRWRRRRRTGTTA